MSEKMKISDYKGFELWDTPAPEGWRVHQYPVQVTCNGEHVNCFADAHEAMSVIDGMDADTIAYHMRRAPATEPTAAAQGEVCRCGYPMADHDADGECPGDGYTGQRSPDQILTPTELVHLWREMKADPHDIHKQLAYFKSLADARLTDGYKFIDERNALAAELASLEAALQQAQRERDAALAALEPFANQWAEWTKVENEWVHDPDTAMDIVEFFADYADNDVVAKHLKAAYDALAASAQQAAQPADGEG